MSAAVPLVVAVDLDEVLGYFVETLARFHNEVYGSSLTAEHFHSYDFVDVWGGTREEATEKVMAFFESSHFQEELPPVPGAYQILLDLKRKGIDFHLVTSRQFRIQPETEKWIEKHYPDIFTALHYGNHYATSGTQHSKAEMCQAIGARLLIDDSLRYALQVATEAGIEVLLFGDYAWNQPDSSLHPSLLPPLVTRVTHWDAVKERIEAMHDEHRSLLLLQQQQQQQ
ncbi:haloacid dehalogenase-like hydrolase superfamily protein [Nannochloropsis oceanica]